jgi:hypothetical protein
MFFDSGYCDLVRFFRIHHINAFIFKFVTIPARLNNMARQHVLNIYNDSNVYIDIFKFEFREQVIHYRNIA